MLKVLGLLVLVSATYAALYRFPPEEKPADLVNQEGCYLSHLKRVVQYNLYFYPNTDCARYLCLPGNNETIYETCVAVAVRPGCRLTTVDLKNSYPLCCGREICDVTTTQAPTTTTQTPTTPTTQRPVTPTTPTRPTTPGQTPTTPTPTTPGQTTPTTTTLPPGSRASAQASSGPNAQARATAS